MDEPTQEQIKKFWEGYGFKFIELAYPEKRWRYPDGTEGGWLDPEGILCFQLPPIDLNNLFRYAVTKLQDKGIVIDLIAYEHKGFGCITTSVIDKKTLVVTRDDDPTLALFWAINNDMANNLQEEIK